MATGLEAKREELHVKQSALAAVYAEMGTDFDVAKVISIKGTNVEKVAEIKRMNDELSGLGKEVEGLSEIAKNAANVKGIGDQWESKGGVVQPSGKPAAEQKSLGQLFVESKSYTDREQGYNRTSEMPFSFKTAMTAAAGFAPQSIRSGVVSAYPSAPANVLDVLPQGTTTQAAYVYMRGTTYTNNAAEIAENGTGAAAEVALAWTEQTASVRDIVAWLPITAQQLDDNAGLQDLVNSQLMLMLRQRANKQCLVGDGNAPNIDGLTHASGVQTQAMGTDSALDAIYKGIVLSQNTGYSNPTHVVLHPNDWSAIRLTATSEGIYLYGSPADPTVNRIWGLPVIVTSDETEGTGLVTDVNQCMFVTRHGIVFSITDSHSDYFIYGKMAIKAVLRAAFPIFRPSANVKVTGI